MSINEDSSSLQATPTVRPVTPFDPKGDANELYKALEGSGCNEKAVIDILAHRTTLQRLEIAKSYKTLFGKDLLENLKSKLRGDFEDLVVAMMTPTTDYIAKELHRAMSRLGTNEKTLIEFLCSATNSDIMAVQAAYEKMYNKTLESDIVNETSGDFQRLLVSICQAQRDENLFVDHMQAVTDAQNLLQAGELSLKFIPNEMTFHHILCSRSFPQLAQVFQEYKNKAGHDIEDAVKKQFGGDVQSGLLAIISCVKDRHSFFADQLYDTMKGLGTRDHSLMRLVILRSEIDMQEIKKAFMQKYGKTLEECIEGDTSGDYKNCLLALVN